MMTEKMPQNIDAERLILGSMINNIDLIPDILSVCKTQYFFDKMNQQIFSTIVRMYDSNLPIDSVALFENLQRNKINFDRKILNEILDNSTYRENAVYHVFVIIEKFVLRKLIEKSKEIIGFAFREKEDVFDLLYGSLSDLENLLEIREEAKPELNLYESLEEIFSKIRDERAGKLESSFKTGSHPSFDRATGGLRAGNLVAISGYFKTTKTTFGASLIGDFAVNQKLNVGWFSLEISSYEMGLKFISLQTGTRYSYLRNPSDKNRYGEFRYKDESLMNTVADAMRKFVDTKIFIDDRSGDINQIINKIRLFKKKHQIQIVAIDYLQLINTKGKFERRDLLLAELTRKLKQVAKELEIIIFIVSQENKEGESADGKSLLRDCDFWFSATNLSEKGIKTFRFEDQDGIFDVPINSNHFLLTNRANRHGVAGTKILYQFCDDGRYKEVDFKHNV